MADLMQAFSQAGIGGRTQYSIKFQHGVCLRGQGRNAGTAPQAHGSRN
jgi:hypothetical protein